MKEETVFYGQLKRENEALKKSLLDAEGVADLAIKHRDTAERETAALMVVLKNNSQIIEGLRKDNEERGKQLEKLTKSLGHAKSEIALLKETLE